MRRPAVFWHLVVFLFVLEIDFALFLIWIQLPVYWLHQFEEYVFPGGFLETFNKKVLGSNENEWPISKRAALWINIPIIFIAFPLSAILAGTVDISIGIWTAYFSILNAASHAGMFVIKWKYNPGFFISAFLNIPVGVFTVWYFYSNNVISTFGHLISDIKYRISNIGYHLISADLPRRCHGVLMLISPTLPFPRHRKSRS